MEIYIEQGESKMDCELKIASKYNRQFQILSQKEIRLGGFLGLFSKPGIQVEFYFPRDASLGVMQRQPNGMTMSRFPPNSFHTSSGSMQNTDIAFKKRASGEEQRNHVIEEEKIKVLAAASNARQASYHGLPASAGGSGEASQRILEELKKLTEKLESSGGKNGEHPGFKRARDLLKSNDFSESYTDSMMEKLRKDLTVNQLDNWDTVQDHLLHLIGESISIFKEDPAARKPKIMVLVGPTGVGKTTTISKLAAIYGIGINDVPAIDVKMITIDAFRIGAKDQIEQIGNIMQIPVSCAVNRQELKKEIALLSEGTDLFLIDTIGKSPKDSAKLGEMKEILDGAGRNAEFHLVISAGTKTSDMEEIMRQFEPFNYKSVILSKMDETDRIGNIISALAAKRKCVSYITDGQTVPVDIKKASVVRFLINLDGFKIDRDKIELRFPSGDADQFRWR
ncbi:MAG: AAA family ATPase [Treponema sp.]|nr:AAA family ATPase [Treponema sp.]